MEKWTRLLVILATSLLLLIFVGVLIRLGAYIHHTLLLFALGALIAYALDPLVEILRRTPLGRSQRVSSRELSVSAVFVCLFLLIGLAVWLLEGNLVAQFTAVQHDFPRYHRRALALAADVDRNLAARGIHFSLSNALQHPPHDAQVAAEQVGRQVLPFLGDVFKDIGESVIVLLITLYFLLFGAEMRERFNGLLPPRVRERANLWETDVNRILGSFVRGQLIIALVMGAAAALGCLVMGMHIWLLIGLFVVAASLIPVFGPYIGAVPAVVAALIGPVHLFGYHLGPVPAAIIIVVYFTIINELGSKVLYPKLVGDALGLHIVLVLFVLFAGLEIAGIVGVLFAAPLTALTIVTVVHLYRFWQDLPDNLLSSVSRSEGRKTSQEPLP